MKKFLSIFMVLLLALGLVACASDSPQQAATPPPAPATGEPAASAEPGAAPEETAAADPVYIGVVMPLSGTMADQGNQDVDGIKLAVKHINDAGGIKSLGGAKIELVIEDATSDSAQTKNVVERLLSQQSVSAVLGVSSSGITLPSCPVFEKYEVPLITGCQTNELTESGYKYVFQHTVKNRNSGGTQVDFFLWLNEKQGGESAKTCAIIYENQPSAVSNRDGIIERLKDTDLQVVYDESYPQGITDASSIAMKMKNANADVVFFYGAITETALIRNAMLGVGYNPLFIGGAGTAWPSFAKQMSDGAEGLVSVVNANYDLKAGMEDPTWKAIGEEFMATYGYFMTEHGTNNYVALQIAAQALENAASRDPKAVREALSTLKMDHPNMPGGVIEFDETGYNPYARAIIVQWQEGVCRTVYPEELASAEYVEPQS